MKKIPAIAGASFKELTRQPAALLLTSGGVALMIVLAHTSYFALGEEARQAQQSMLALMLLAGMLAAVLGASSAIAREVRSGTALALLAKPIGRLPFLLGKFLGLAAALALQGGVHLMGVLLASRMAQSASGKPDGIAIGVLLACLLAPLLLGAVANYFVHASCVGTAQATTPGFIFVAFLVLNGLDANGHPQTWGTNLDRGLATAGLLILTALPVLAAIALALSTRLSLFPSLILCIAVLLVGLLSDHLLGSVLVPDSPLRLLVHAVVPNWQVFWAADALGHAHGIPWNYVLKASAYALLHLSTALSVAWFLFLDREIR